VGVWDHLRECVEVEWKLTTVVYYQTDGQTERMIASMEEYLQVVVHN